MKSDPKRCFGGRLLRLSAHSLPEHAVPHRRQGIRLHGLRGTAHLTTGLRRRWRSLVQVHHLGQEYLHPGPILYGWREGDKHHWCGDRDQGDVWSFDKPTAIPLHPTTKPVPLMQRAIENSSRIGDIVLDPFMGSGTSIIACERSGRICYGMELEPHYVDVSVKRWEAFTGERATKESP